MIRAAQDSPPHPPESDPPSGARLRDQFEAFVRFDEKRIRRSLAKLGIPWHDADDLLQGGYEKLWRRHREVRPEAWGKWLRVTITNDKRDRQRAYARAEKQEAGVTHQTRLDRWEAGPAPEASLGALQVGAVLTRLVGELEPKRREVARLHFLEEAELAEVAAELGMSAEEAKTLWRLARKELRAAVNKRRARERFATRGLVSFACLLWWWEQRWTRVQEQRWKGITARIRPAAGLSLMAFGVAMLLVTHAPRRPVTAAESFAAIASTSGTLRRLAGNGQDPGHVDVARGAPVQDEPPSSDATAAPRLAPAAIPRTAATATAILPPVAGAAPVAPPVRRTALVATAVMRAAPGAVHNAGSGLSEEALIRLAVQAMELRPEHALALLDEHARRFPANDVAVRGALRRAASEAAKQAEARKP